MTDTDHDLRARPRDPYNYIVIGVVVTLIGSAVASLAGPPGALILMVGGPILFVGLVAQGVLVGMRMAQYFEYLDRTIEAGDEVA